MKIIKYTFLFLFISIGLVSCSDDDSSAVNDPQDETNLEFRQELNVSYGNDGNQVFDIYLPAGRTLNTKVMILVHGGGWTSGDKEDMDPYKDIMLQELPDIAIVNINYRLADQNTLPLPMQTDDITSVINFLKTNQNEYAISTDYGFTGVSAGGHLALLWSYSLDTENDVEMVCSIVGPTNLADPAYTENPIYDPIFEIFGDELTNQYLENSSPLHRVTASAPPTILFYGGQDPLVPTSQGIDMDARLETLGITHEFTFYENEGHGWVGLNLFDTWTKLKLFTETHLE